MQAYQQGLAQATAGEFAAAISSFDQVLQARPDFIEAYYQRGLAYFKLNQFAAAIADYTRSILSQPTNSQLYYARSLAHFSAGNIESAVADVKDAIRYRSDYPAAYHLLGTIRQKQNLPTKAIASYKKAAELYLDQPDIANCRRCLERIRQLTPASVVPVGPPALSSAEFLQQALQKAKRNGYPSAIEDLNWAIQIDSQEVEAYVCRAQLRAESGDAGGAISDYRQAAQLYLDRFDKVKAQQMLTRIEQLKLKSVSIQPSSVQPSSVQPRRTFSQSPRPFSAQASGRVSPTIQRKLLRLVGADRKIAAGLVDRLRQRHPGMPEDWYWEKAIYDLERDRR